MGMAFQFKKNNRRKLAVLTAYDAPTAELVWRSGADMILVGDSLATVILGHKSTREVSMDEMIHHTKAVRRGAPKAFIVADMPFEAVTRGDAFAKRCAKRFVSESHANAVKIEWGNKTPGIVKAVIAQKIPVMGHVGLTPQTAEKTGGLRVRGRSSTEALAVYKAAKAFESSGAFSLVLECVPRILAKKITCDTSFPTIGIGAGADLGGQILVLQDIVGLSTNVRPRFAARYADSHATFKKCIERFISQVRSSSFPKPKHTFKMNRKDFQDFLDKI